MLDLKATRAGERLLFSSRQLGPALTLKGHKAKDKGGKGSSYQGWAVQLHSGSNHPLLTLRGTDMEPSTDKADLGSQAKV